MQWQPCVDIEAAALLKLSLRLREGGWGGAEGGAGRGPRVDLGTTS